MFPRALISLLLLCFFALPGHAKKLTALFYSGSFTTKESGPYLETYLNVIGNSCLFLPNENGKFQSKIDVELSLSIKDSIIVKRNYNLLSPEVSDTNSTEPNFIDVQRFLIPEGNYRISLKISDANLSGKSLNHVEEVTISFPKDKPSFSSVELVESYTKTTERNILSKSGIDLVPMVSNLYRDNINEINFYAELYNVSPTIGPGENFVLNAFIESFENGFRMPGFFRFSRQSAASIIPWFASFPLKQLPTGNYNLVVEARNKDNLLLADQKIFFQRKNSSFIPETAAANDSTSLVNSFVDRIHSMDTLTDYINSLRPISSQMEITFASNAIKSGDERTLKLYFFNFWSKRDAANPEAKWKAYKKEVDYVNAVFKTNIKKGYITDRGRVYLQYGKPSQRLTYDREPSMFPYEIWQYYTINNGPNTVQRNNRKFVFYNPDLVTNDYFLLHSDAIGELRDDNWQTRLQKRNNAFNDLDINRANSHWGSNLDDAINMSR
jgi:GWxTD domain-containing protein